MPRPSRLRAGRLAPRRLARGVARRVRDRRGPTLSVVIPVFDGEQHLAEALESLLAQRYRHLDVVVVDDGSRDASRSIAESFAARDARVRVLSQANAGQSAARNTGVAVATGSYLTFVDADDLVTHEGIDAAVRGLERSGSDLAVMPYQRLEPDGSLKRAAPWIRALHARPAERVTLVERPDVMVNAIACAKIFRRTFWDAAGLAFPPGVIYEDQILTAHAYRDAEAIDVTREVAYSWRRMETSTSQGQVTVANVTARMDAAEESLRLLEPVPSAREERALQLLEHNVPNSTLKLERANDPYLAVLVERVPRLVAAVAPDRYRSTIPAQHRVMNALLEAGDHDAVWRFVRAEGLQSQLFDLVEAPSPDAADRAVTSIDLPGRTTDGLDPWHYVATSAQVALRTSVRDVRREGESVVVDVRAWFPHADHADARLSAQLLAGRADATAVVEHLPEQDAVFTSRAGTRRPYPGTGWRLTFAVPSTVRVDDGELLLELDVDRPRLEGSRSHRVALPR